MSRIIDLTESGGDTEILTSTSTSGGLLGGGKVLASDPLETYLYENEEPKYALRNKKAGIEIEAHNGTEHIKPGEDYQAVALVTDVRLLFVIGNESGDEMVDIPLTEIIEAKSESDGFRTSALVIVTEADEIWQFACTGDVSEVASAVDEMAYVWANAQRLLDETEEQLSESERKLTDRKVPQARDVLGDSQEKIETAVKRIKEVGPAAQRHIESRARTLADWLLDVQRQLMADEAAQAHRQAQRAWQDREYEAAAQEYESVIEAYQEALSTDGPTPSDDTLERRLSGALTERELLRAAPLIDADTARREAIEEDDPEKAASGWEDALDGYRELLTLEWAKDTREFVAEKEEIRDQTIEIADDAIEDHMRAGRQWIQSADQLAIDGHDEQASEVYSRAQRQFELAEQLASEVRPEQLDQIDDAITLVNDRLQGNIPDEVPDDPTLETVELTDSDTEKKEATETRTQSESQQPPQESNANEHPQGTTQTTHHQEVSADGSNGTTTNQRATGQSAENGHSEAVNATEATNARGGPHSTERSTSQQPTNSPDSADHSGGTESSAADSSGDNPGRGNSSLIDQIKEQKQHSSHKQNTRSGSPPSNTSPSVTDEQIQRTLEQLPEPTFNQLVAELWDAQGWDTEVFSIAAQSAFDIVAFREQPADERLGVWTVHDTEAVDTSVVTDCVQARNASRGADAATIITTATVTTAGLSRAQENEITIIDAAELASLLNFENLVDTLFELADA